jgi:hypothetical protein
MAESSALVLAYVVEILVILGATLSLLGWLRGRTRVSYRIAALGALGFMLSQVVHLPLNLGLGRLLPSAPGQLWISALALGLSAGLCEELTRYAMLRTLAKGVRHEGSALMLGAGHGGIEALIIAGMAHARAREPAGAGQRPERVPERTRPPRARRGAGGDRGAAGHPRVPAPGRGARAPDGAALPLGSHAAGDAGRSAP